MSRNPIPHVTPATIYALRKTYGSSQLKVMITFRYPSRSKAFYALAVNDIPGDRAASAVTAAAAAAAAAAGRGGCRRSRPPGVPFRSRPSLGVQLTL